MLVNRMGLNIKSITLKAAIRDIWQWRTKLFILLVLMSLLGGFIGYIKSIRLPMTSDGVAINVYDETLKSYEFSISKIKGNIKEHEDKLYNRQGDNLDITKTKATINRYKKQLIDVERQKKYYERIHKPKNYGLKSPFNAAAKYSGFSAILAIVMALTYAVLREICSTKVRYIDELKGLGIPIIVYSDDIGNNTFFAELGLFLERQRINGLHIQALTNYSVKCKKLLQNIFMKYGVLLTIGDNISNSVDELYSLAKAKGTIILIRLCETEYYDVEYYFDLCQRQGIKVYGLIVVGYEFEQNHKN